MTDFLASLGTHTRAAYMWTQSQNTCRQDTRIRFATLLARFAPDYLPLIIKITGTNGKGSTCAMLEACLRHIGKRTGLFTSPHLFHITERIRIDGLQVTMFNMDAAMDKLLPDLQTYVQQQQQLDTVINMFPSFFEVLVLLALRMFAQSGVEIAIMEVGAGGCLDPVSMLPQSIAAITNVGLDHQCILGNSIAEIATNKARIVHDGGELLLGANLHPDALNAILFNAKIRGIHVIQANMQAWQIDNISLAGTDIVLRYAGKQQCLHLALAGTFQIYNLALVWELLRHLAIKNIINNPLSALIGIEKTHWLARMQYIAGKPAFLFDGAHNAHALRVLEQELAQHVDHKVLIFGTSYKKDITICAPILKKMLKNMDDELYLVSGFHHATSLANLQSKLATQTNYTASFPNIATALQHMQHKYKDENTLIIITGSLFLAAAGLCSILEKLNTSGTN